MSHDNVARERARATIRQLEHQISAMQSRAFARAEEAAVAEFPHRTRPQFKVGGSAETQQLRSAFYRHYRLQLDLRAPLIAKLQRKIDRIRGHFGFND